MNQPSREDRKRCAVRAAEWRTFRRNFYYSQLDLANALSCARRTVVSIEGARTVSPRLDLLKRFRILKQKHEKGEIAWS